MIEEIHAVRYKKGTIELDCRCYDRTTFERFMVKIKGVRKIDTSHLADLADALSDLVEQP